MHADFSFDLSRFRRSRHIDLQPKINRSRMMENEREKRQINKYIANETSHRRYWKSLQSRDIRYDNENISKIIDNIG